MEMRGVCMGVVALLLGRACLRRLVGWCYDTGLWDRLDIGSIPNRMSQSQ